MGAVFRKAIDILNREFPIFTGRVLDIGPPIMDASIPTACIATNKEDRSFTFRFNPDFAKSLTAEELAFVMAHEALHVLRNDPKVMMSGEYDDIPLLNQAMDCIINDSLVNARLGKMPEGGCAGPAMVGKDCSKSSVREVYDALAAKRDEKGREKQEDGEPGEGGSSSSGSGDDDGSKATGSHDWDDDTAAAAERFANPGEDDGDTAGHVYGGAWKHAERHPIEEGDVARLDLHAMLNELDPDIVLEHGAGPKQRKDWRMPARRYAGLAQRGTFIPATRDWKDARAMTTKKYQIVVGCDISGSVDSASLRVFSKLLSALPTDYAEFVFVAVASGAIEMDDEARRDVTERNVQVRAAVNGQVIRENGRSWRPDYPVGGGDGMPYYYRNRADWGLPNTREDIAELLLMAPELSGSDMALNRGIEAEALQCWIMDAVKRGRLEKYPRAVLFISDMGTCLTLASREQAARWLCVYNHDGRVPRWRYDVTKPELRLRQSRTQRTNTSGGQPHGNCKLSVRQMRALSEWLRR